jgi:GntR family transcriptional regulator
MSQTGNVPTPVSAILLGHVSPAGEGPLYQQIIAAVRREIADGRLAPGSAMPSFRVLAREMSVSLITVKRAYEDLERDGILYLRQGLGTFVSEGAYELSRGAKIDDAVFGMRKAVREAREAGLDEGRIRELFDQVIHEGDASS